MKGESEKVKGVGVKGVSEKVKGVGFSEGYFGHFTQTAGECSILLGACSILLGARSNNAKANKGIANLGPIH